MSGAEPADLPAPVVIAQHLDPARPSNLAEILARPSSLPVRSVEPHEPLVSGTVFVVPSNRQVTITDYHIDVHPDAERRPTPPSISCWPPPPPPLVTGLLPSSSPAPSEPERPGRTQSRKPEARSSFKTRRPRR